MNGGWDEVDLLLKMLMLMMMFLEVTMRAMIAVRRAGGNWHVGCDWGYIYKTYIQIIPMIYIYSIHIIIYIYISGDYLDILF